MAAKKQWIVICGFLAGREYKIGEILPGNTFGTKMVKMLEGVYIKEYTEPETEEEAAEAEEPEAETPKREPALVKPAKPKPGGDK